MNQKIAMLITLLLTLVFLSACATHELVRPGARGIHSVKVHADTPEITSSKALSQARSYCKEVEKTKAAYILTERTSYKGSMSERNFRAAKTFGNAGLGLIGLGANAMAADGGYNTKMTFTCKQPLTARR